MNPTTKLCSLLVAVLIASLPVTFAVELRLTYDANGNLVTGDGKYRVYNSLNQLAAMYNGTGTNGTPLENYTYHPTEERILKKVAYNTDGSVRETTYYLTQTFVRVVNASGTYDFTYVYHQGQLVAQRVNGTTLFMANDQKGDIIAVINATGNVIENTSYGPFGTITSGATLSRKGYEGKEADTLVGDTDFNARKYRQDLGIFTQPDSMIPNVYDPQTLNRYSFEKNNPYRYQDKTGHLDPDWLDGLGAPDAVYNLYRGSLIQPVAYFHQGEYVTGVASAFLNTFTSAEMVFTGPGLLYDMPDGSLLDASKAVPNFQDDKRVIDAHFTTEMMQYGKQAAASPTPTALKPVLTPRQLANQRAAAEHAEHVRNEMLGFNAYGSGSGHVFDITGGGLGGKYGYGTPTAHVTLSGGKLVYGQA